MSVLKTDFAIQSIFDSVISKNSYNFRQLIVYVKKQHTTRRLSGCYVVETTKNARTVLDEQFHKDFSYASSLLLYANSCFYTLSQTNSRVCVCHQPRYVLDTVSHASSFDSQDGNAGSGDKQINLFTEYIPKSPKT